MVTPLLLIESSGPGCSVAIAELGAGEPHIAGTAAHTEAMQHTAQLLPLIRQACAQAEIELAQLAGVAVSEGPGSYTGLRAGLSTAKGLCEALGVPLLQVSTLAALARTGVAARAASGRQLPTRVLALLRARRREVYAALYDATGSELIAPHTAEADDAWLSTLTGDNQTLIAGQGLPEIIEQFSESVEHVEVPLHATNLLSISAEQWAARDFADLPSAVPRYIKPPYITTAKPRL